MARPSVQLHPAPKRAVDGGEQARLHAVARRFAGSVEIDLWKRHAG